MNKHILRLTNNFAGIKVNGAGAATISLATDLKLAAESISGTPTVQITGATFSGEAGSAITVTRNTEDIFNITPSTASEIDFSQMGMCDNINATYDIIVTITGKAQIYLQLHKTAGYKTTWRPEQEGSGAG